MRDFSLEHTVHVTVKQTTSIFKFAWAKFKWVFYLIYPKWQFLVKRNKREKRQIKCELCEIQLKRSDIRLLYDTGKSF